MRPLSTRGMLALSLLALLSVPAATIAAATTRPAQEPARRDVVVADRVMRVFKTPQPERVAELLSDLYGDAVKASGSAMMESVIVIASPQMMERVAETISMIGDEGERQVRVFTLKYSDPEQLSRLLSNLLPDGSEIEADERTRSLVLAGPAKTLNVAMDLVQTLDRPDQTAAAAPQDVRVFKLQYSEVDQGFQNVLQQLLGRRGSVAIDPRTNTVILQTDPASMAELTKIIEQLDVPRERKAPPSAAQSRALRVRVVWLVTESPESPPPPEDLKEVVEELRKIGVADLRLAAQAVVATVAGPPSPGAQLLPRPGAPAPPAPRPVRTGESFTVSASPFLWESRCDLSLTGVFTESESANPRLQLALEVTKMTASPGGPTNTSKICSISTTVSAPLGHAVVLGVTPIEDRTSVFVLQLLGE